MTLIVLLLTQDSKWSFGTGLGIEYARFGINSSYSISNDFQVLAAFAPYKISNHFVYQLGLQIIEAESENPRFRFSVLYGRYVMIDRECNGSCDDVTTVFDGFSAGFGSFYNLYQQLKLDFSLHISISNDPFINHSQGFFVSTGFRYLL
ncbi:MAG: hypothetical protein KDD94_01230 [Calditrichaeota bacterium]|nr:hypothetical protein [Calditrichota bacterium]